MEAFFPWNPEKHHFHLHTIHLGEEKFKCNLFSGGQPFCRTSLFTMPRGFNEIVRHNTAVEFSNMSWETICKQFSLGFVFRNEKIYKRLQFSPLISLKNGTHFCNTEHIYQKAKETLALPATAHLNWRRQFPA